MAETLIISAGRDQRLQQAPGPAGSHDRPQGDTGGPDRHSLERRPLIAETIALRETAAEVRLGAAQLRAVAAATLRTAAATRMRLRAVLDPTLPPRVRFSVAIAYAPGAAVVSLHGVLDQSGLVALEAAFDEIDRQVGFLRVVVDLRDAGGIHPSVLPVFSTAAGRAARRGVTFEVWGASPVARAALRSRRC